MKRLHALTSLRWFAAFAVLLTHVNGKAHFNPGGVGERLMPQGVLGVSFFFVLSGFVLTWSHRDSDSTSGFYRRRFARVYPAYAVACIFAAVYFVAASRHVGFREVFSLSLLQSFLPTTKYYLALTQVGWSLSAEAFFYAVFPFALARLTGRSLVQRRVLFVVCVTTPALFALATQPKWGSVPIWLMYVFPPMRALEFVAGILVALELRDGTLPRIDLRLASAAAFGAYVAAGFVPQWFMWVPLGPLPFAMLIAAVAQRDAQSPIRPLHWRPLVWLGEASYAFYLVHLTVLQLLLLRFSDGASTVLVLPSALVVAALLHHVVEKPFEPWLRQPKAKPVYPLATTSAQVSM